MIKYFGFVLLAFIALLSLSCEEDFNPKGELKDKYILTCILRADTAVQQAFLTRSYDAEVNNPFPGKDPVIRNAEIKLWEGDSVYLFKINAFRSTDSSEHNYSADYYLSNYKPKSNQIVEIEALLSNGRRLKGTTRLPRSIDMDFSLSDTIIPPAKKNYVVAAWHGTEELLFYLPLLKIIYFKKVANNEIRYEKPVAMDYKYRDGKNIPAFPEATSQCIFACDMEVIDRAMKEISEGDPQKENYTVLTLLVEVFVLDRNLSAFYSSRKLISDGFSININQADFTNIEGGLGIFGSYIKKSFLIAFDKKYIKSFGYLSGLP